MNIKMMLVGLGGLAIFIWAKMSPKTEAGIGGSPEEKVSATVFDKLEEGAKKILGIVGGGGAVAKVGLSVLPKAGILPKAVLGMLPTVGSVTIPVTALPSATVLPKAVLGMLPKVAPTTVKTAVAPVAGKAGTTALKTLGGAGLLVAPLVVVPVIAKFLDSIFGIGTSGLYDDPELVKEQEAITAQTKAYIEAGDMDWNPKTGFVADPDDPSAFPGGS